MYDTFWVAGLWKETAIKLQNCAYINYNMIVLRHNATQWYSDFPKLVMRQNKKTRSCNEKICMQFNFYLTN